MFPRRLTQLLVSLPAVILLLITPTLPAQTFNRRGQSFPSLNFPQNSKGANLPVTLGTNLHAVADWYGKTDAEFQELCKHEQGLSADRQGRLHYVCAGITAAQGSSSGWGTSGTVFQAPYADSQTFLLHSKPGASKVIYLDFDGNTTSGTAWNTNFTAGASVVTPAYDVDGNPGTTSPTEKANIQLIWQAVAEDYAPFDVDVTTQDPGVEALRKTSAGDTFYGIRVCIGGSSLDWLKVTSGGITYLSSFDWNSDTPAFVFPAQLSNGNPKFVAEAISHEVGHSFGLNHAGQTNGTEYYGGQGNWAPIMGTGYYKDVVQWSKGEYTLSNNAQDDLAIIASYLPNLGDAVGNDSAHATALTGTALVATGLIEKTGDVDVFSFSTGAGSVSLTAKPAAPAANLNLLFSLYNSSGTLITTAGPANASTGATIATTLAAGTYFLAVNGVGSGDPVSTGFSNYGSVGQFSISGTVVSATNQAPVAAASATPTTGIAPVAVTFSSTGSKDSDGSIASYSWNFGDGMSSTVANPAHTYAAAGTYAATLTVFDNYGVASAPVTVKITATANQAPVAVAGASTTSGTAPAAITFSSTGSKDNDGTIASYSWNFGDGTTATTANPAHTYSAAGTYKATLTVKDNLGLASAAASVTITISAPVVYISTLTVTKTKGSGGTSATVIATVKDQSGALKSGAMVTGTWSGGLVSGSASGKTSSNGTVSLKSSATTKTGTITFTVTGITLSGYTYSSSKNAVGTISIAVP